MLLFILILVFLSLIVADLGHCWTGEVSEFGRCLLSRFRYVFVGVAHCPFDCALLTTDTLLPFPFLICI